MCSRVLNFLTSLRLTVVLLCLALLLVLFGTLAQVHIGLYEAQTRYFHSMFVTWTVPGTYLTIPVFPGGLLLGSALLVNLIAAHLKRFKFGWKSSGLLLTHAGLILLLVGQLITEFFQVESFMRIGVGESRNYAESSRKEELALIDVTSPDHDRVISFSASMLAKQGDITHESLPFVLRVKRFLPNSVPAMAKAGETGGLQASQGIGSKLQFTPLAPTATMDGENKPAALVEIVSEGKSVGTWTVSTWFTKPHLVEAMEREFGASMANELKSPQSFTVGDRSYQLAVRPTRYYKPYSLSLVEFKRELYPGSDIPKSFSSRVHLSDPAQGESRDVLIFMNNPLRYRGETYYQSGFEQGDRVTILQVVKNPASIVPYVSSTLISIGLITQFLIHLFGFARKRKRAAGEPGAEPVLCASPVPAAGRSQP